MMLSNSTFNAKNPLSYYCSRVFTRMLSKIYPRYRCLSQYNTNMLIRHILNGNYGRYCRTIEKGHGNSNHKPIEKLSYYTILKEIKLQDFVSTVDSKACDHSIYRKDKILAYLFIKNYFII